MSDQLSTGKGGDTVLEAIKAQLPSIALMRGLTGALVLESSVQSGSIQGINDRQAG